MARYKHHIFVCGNQRPPESARPCCDPEGNAELHAIFKTLLIDRGLKTQVRANKAGCLDHCEHGPTVVIYPDEVWYGNVRPDDAAVIVDSHIAAGKPVERLRLDENCINNRECPHRLAGKKTKTLT